MLHIRYVLSVLEVRKLKHRGLFKLETVLRDVVFMLEAREPLSLQLSGQYPLGR